jgi:hypothetical protein
LVLGLVIVVRFVIVHSVPSNSSSAQAEQQIPHG